MASKRQILISTLGSAGLVVGLYAPAAAPVWAVKDPGTPPSAHATKPTSGEEAHKQNADTHQQGQPKAQANQPTQAGGPQNAPDQHSGKAQATIQANQGPAEQQTNTNSGGQARVSATDDKAHEQAGAAEQAHTQPSNDAHQPTNTNQPSHAQPSQRAAEHAGASDQAQATAKENAREQASANLQAHGQHNEAAGANPEANVTGQPRGQGSEEAAENASTNANGH